MNSASYDLAYLQAGVAALEAYLLSGEVYWPLDALPPAGAPAFPRLTLGGVLLAHQRLSARPGSPQGDSTWREVEATLETTRQRWTVAWQNKAQREFSARLRLWQAFMNEFRAHPREHLDRYPYEVRRRAMLELLGRETREIASTERELLGALDQLLEALFVRGGFVWEAEDAAAFPEKPYWYLWGTPKKGL